MNTVPVRFNSKRPVGGNPYSRLAATNYASLFPLDLHDSPAQKDAYACILSLGCNDDFESKRSPSTLYSEDIFNLGKLVTNHISDKRFSQVSVHGLIPKLLQNPNYPESSEFRLEDYALDGDDFDIFIHSLMDGFAGRYDLGKDSYDCDNAVVPFPEQRRAVNYD